MWELGSESPRHTLTDLRYVRTDTTHIIRMPAHPMATTVRTGLRAEYLSVPARGITGAGTMTDIWVVVDIGDTANLGAMTATVARVRVMATPEATSTATPVTMRVAAMDTVTQMVDSTGAEKSAAADSTVGAEVASITVVDTAAVAGN